ncbi:MAG: YfcC family protein [Sphingobacteriales bacterium]
MASLKKLPSPITILFIVIIIAAAATWLLPAGEYDTLSYNSGSFTINTVKGDKTVPVTQHTLDSLKILITLNKFKSGDIFKPVAIPGTYHQLKSNKQGFLEVIQAPVKGLYDSSDIIFFLLFIGGFIAVFQQTGAMEEGVTFLSHKMKGQEAWLIIIITFFFAFCGAAEGMAEEGLAFYPILVPLYLAAGYDLLVPVAVIFAGTNIGNMASFSNPFSTVIASNAAGINWTDGIYERLLFFAITTAITIWYIVRYAQKVKKYPAASLVYRFDGAVKSNFPSFDTEDGKKIKLEPRNALQIVIFLGTIGIMIGGFIEGWSMVGATALFIVSSVLIAVIARMKEKVFMDTFIEGVKSLVSVTLIVGVARGVTIVLNDGHISGTLLFYSAMMVGKMHAVWFILIMMGMYMVFTLFISSSSGMAVLTMPIFGSLAVIVGVPGKEIVNAYLFGMGIMGLVTPTGIMLPSLDIANVSVKVWLKFVYPLMVILLLVSAVFLVVGVL